MSQGWRGWLVPCVVAAALLVAACSEPPPGGTLAPEGSPRATVPVAPGQPGSAFGSTDGPTAPPIATPSRTVTAAPATDDWLATLRDETAAQNDRVAAVEALAADSDPRVGPALEAALSGSDEQVRIAVATAIGARSDTHAVKPLAAALLAELKAAPGSEFVVAMATALGRLGGAGGVSALLAALRDSDEDGMAAATEALRAIGAPAVAPLQKALTSSDIELRLASVRGLYALGSPGVKPLIVALKNTEAKVRSAAANRLGRLGDLSAEKPLVALLQKPEGKTVSVALARLHRDDPSALLPYLKVRTTVGVYYGLIFIGAEETASAMATALVRFGDVEMATDYLNCGNSKLEQAAHDWAEAHGYTVITTPGSKNETWGSGLPD